jgi:Rad3-related DNA helicase
MLGSTWPFIANDLGEWKAWAARNKPTCDAELSKWESKIGSTRNPPTSWIDVAHHLSNLSRKLATLVLMSPTSWIVDGTEEGYVLDPIRVSPYAERILFNKVPKVTFLSATIRPKSLNMCGVRSSSMDFFEYASPFPVSNAPVYYVPLAKIYQGSTDADYGAMVSGIDQFMKLRQDRKGLIVCNSYKLTEAIRRRSRFQRNMIFNRQEDNVDDMVQRFKKMPSPHVLISPSISTGYDFPGTEAEYVIIPKVPFPDRSKPIVCAREAIDREYSSHHAMQTIVQAVGRPRRTPTDRCEALIADSNMGWFWQRNHYLAPQSFKDCYQESATLPRPISRSVN